MPLTFLETALVVCDICRCRCALTGKRLHDPKRPRFRLVRYEPSRPADASNVLFAVEEAAERHEREGPQALPPALRAQIERSLHDGLSGRPCSLLQTARRALAAEMGPEGRHDQLASAS